MEKVLGALKILLGSSIFFIPSDIPYREVIAEGLYSLSHTVSLIAHTMQCRVGGTGCLGSIPYLMQLLGVLISNLEVFIESATRFIYR